MGVCVFTTVKCHENCIIVTSLMQFKCFYDYKMENARVILREAQSAMWQKLKSTTHGVARVSVSACGKVSTVAVMKNLCCILLGAVGT